MSAHRALLLAEFPVPLREAWMFALATTSTATLTARQIAGTATRLLYEAAVISPDEVAKGISLALSLGTPVPEAAAYFEGFFAGAGQRLIHDARLTAGCCRLRKRISSPSCLCSAGFFRNLDMASVRC